MQNWSRNITYKARDVHFPNSVEQIQKLVRESKRVHAVGSRHSFGTIADSENGELVSLRNLDRTVRVELGQHPSVTVEAGINYSQLATFLHSIGYGLPNLASLPHISVAGAIATSTHGSGDSQRSLASSVRAMKFVKADGEVFEIKRGDSAFDGVVVHLGALGIVIELTLDIIPTFEIEQRVFENLSFDDLTPNLFDQITSSAYSVSFFTDWQNGRFNQVWFKSEPGKPPFDLTQFGSKLATQQRHPVQGAVAESIVKHLIDPKKCTEQLGIPGPWHKRLPHFRIEDEPSTSGQELQSEFIIPRTRALDAMKLLFEFGDRLRPLIQISEIRTIAADDFWMSPFYARDSVGIHFTWHKVPDAVTNILPEIESRLAQFDARPHWGKLFTIDQDRIRSLYADSLPRFQSLAHRLDPNGKFRNSFLDALVF
ncbi:MAG TPA: FAD-binding protein [Tepidisphaeraceae bacterium]|nr:FAD-binding protein [Tepidisphaeraceae bacterium]